MGVETFPPLLLIGTRFTLSGGLLFIAARMKGVPLPAPRDLMYSACFGVLALGIGNGCLTVAEQWIPSSLAALLTTTSPFWMVGLEALTRGGDRLHGPTIAGMLVGLAGTVILVGPDALRTGFSGDVTRGFLVLQLGCLSWAVAAVAQRRRSAHINAVMSGAIQQLGAGVTALIPALLLGLEPSEWSLRGVGAVLYLMTFGSIVGYTSYVYALKKLPVAIVAIYTFVNPIVAAALGWLIFREQFGIREALAMGIIFLGVAIVKRFGEGPRKAGPPLSEPTPSPALSPPSARQGSAAK